jgi:hypothetical protein
MSEIKKYIVKKNLNYDNKEYVIGSLFFCDVEQTVERLIANGVIEVLEVAEAEVVTEVATPAKAKKKSFKAEPVIADTVIEPIAELF